MALTIKQAVAIIEGSGVRFPITRYAAMKYRGVGVGMVDLMSKEGLILDSELEQLSTRSRNILVRLGIATKQQALRAIASGKLLINSPNCQDYGKKSRQEVLAWAGS